MSTQTSHSPIISWRRALLDGTVMNSTLSVLIYSSLAINAEMWLQDYPPDIKAAFGPKSKKAQIQSMILTIPFFGILLGGVIWSNRKLREENGGALTFKAAFWHTYALFAYFWLFDLTILDWLIGVTLKPSFMVLPGTEGMAGYDDYAFHLTASLPAIPLMAIPALIVAFFVRSKPAIP
ncbi:MAG: hypothetical protein KC443_12255 [Anaerolineales bacterium]|nr:hypothetical protein [Anaerolineales bacterium]MCB8967308.1 hypothetical protein [Ardenticatenaceae bacterium]